MGTNDIEILVDGEVVDSMPEALFWHRLGITLAYNHFMRAAILLGRLSNGLESDKGSLVHAVVLKPAKRPKRPYNDFGRKLMPNDTYSIEIALCGAKPTQRSVGWSETDLAVSYPKCLKRLAKS